MSKFQEEILRKLIPAIDDIDINDSYQVYCVFYVNYCECIECHKRLELLEIGENGGTSAWARLAAQFVRAHGWFIPSRDEFHYLIAFCPECSPGQFRGGRESTINNRSS